MNNNVIIQKFILIHFKGDREKPEVIVINKLLGMKSISYKSIYERIFLHHRCK